MNHEYLSSNYNVGAGGDIAAPRKRLALLLLLAAVLQLPAVFLGIDLCDSGFYATFYDNIFERPGSVSYNFMYYLSGVAGGTVMSLSGGSLVALRVAGLLCGLICVACVDILGRRLPTNALVAGVLAVCIGIWQTPLSLYNDNMTVALACVSLTCICLAAQTGNRRKATLLILSGGAIAGLNTLTRLPNILEYLFIIVLPLAGIRGKRMARLCGFWTLGWVIGLGAGIALAAALGHLSYLWATLRDLTGMAASDAGESSHSLKALVMAQVNAWWGILKFMVKVSCTAGIAWYIARRIQSRWLKAGIWIVLGVPCLCWLYSAEIVMSLAALSLFGCIASLSRLNDPARMLAAAALLLMAIVPLGSDYGIYNAGAIILWLGAPVGFNVISRNCGTVCAWLACAAICAGGFATAAKGGFYFDDTPIARMSSKAPGEGAGMIRTSPERSKRLDAMLGQLGGVVQPGDTLMVFGSAPMINHLTGTVPAIGCSWPELLTPGMLQSRLDRYPAPRYIMMMRFNTLGSHWGDPSAAYRLGVENANIFHNEEKTQVMDSFINSNSYRVVLETPDFELYSITDPTDSVTPLNHRQP